MLTVDQLLKTYLTETARSLPIQQIKKAILCGDYNQFCQEQSDYIVNLFSVNPAHVTTPLAKLSILRLLADRETAHRNRDESYLSVEDIHNYFDPCGLDRHTLNEHLRDLLQYRLVDPYDPTDAEVYEAQRLKIHHSGRIHLEFSLRDDTYISHMALVTPIREYVLISQIREIMKRKLSKKDWLEIVAIFLNYCLKEDQTFFTLPKNETYDGQSRLRHELRSRWIPS